MKQKPLWQVSVVTSLEAEDAVVELLARVFKLPPAVWTKDGTKIAIISVYCPKRSDWNAAKCAALRNGLADIKASGLKTGAGRILVRGLAREDWHESWKRHFQSLPVGRRLLIRPSWIKRRPGKNQAVVILDPGLSFGTGSHPTTLFCLQEVARRRMADRPQSFCDVGTGSGILAIAAAKLGYGPVRALDIDPEAIRVARKNARQNKVLKCVGIGRADLTKLPLRSREKYDFVCANLITNVLLAGQKQILSRLGAKGMLVLAGILKEEFFEVQRSYEAAGLKLVRSRIEGDWRSGAFQRGA